MEENRELIEKAVSYIDSGCKIAEVSVEEVAQNAGFSMDYFYRKHPSELHVCVNRFLADLTRMRLFI